MDKAQILEERMVDQVISERIMMAALRYPLTVNLRFAAQDQVDLFLVVDLMLGGDLRYHMKSGRIFDATRVRFYTAQAALSINYLHQTGYIHRDIKPDNLLLDADGNVHLTDFNLSIRANDTRRRGVVGTRSYMAPEVVSRQQYGEMVDWWSLGICIYEWSFGTVPFRGSTDEQREAIITQEPRYPSQVDRDLKAIIASLLKKDPTKRFNFEKLRQHPYFDGLDWIALENKTAKTPWKPDSTRANCDGTYDLDEQFQVKRKRAPVVSSEFGAWDWKYGQTTEDPQAARPRRSRTSNAEESVESDGAISDEQASLHDSSDFVAASRTGTSDSIPTLSDAESNNSGSNLKKKNKSPKDTGSSEGAVSSDAAVSNRGNSAIGSGRVPKDGVAANIQLANVRVAESVHTVGTPHRISASPDGSPVAERKHKSSRARKHDSVPASPSKGAASADSEDVVTSKPKSSKADITVSSGESRAVTADAEVGEERKKDRKPRSSSKRLSADYKEREKPKNKDLAKEKEKEDVHEKEQVEAGADANAHESSAHKHGSRKHKKEKSQDFSGETSPRGATSGDETTEPKKSKKNKTKQEDASP